MYGKSENADDYQRIPRPLAAMAIDFPKPYNSGLHHHRRAQLLFAATGTLIVTSAAGTWVVPPLRAVWVPARTHHTLQTVGRCEVRTLFIHPPAAPHLPTDRCVVIHIPPLLRELIQSATRLPLRYNPAGRDGLLVKLLLAELRIIPVRALHLPMPTEPRALRVAQAILAAPDAQSPLAHYARKVFVSEKTLARAFLRQTGMTFGRWRQQARLLASLPRLAAGEPVLNTALSLGYRSPSAFSAMFRRALGISPTRYFLPPPVAAPPRKRSNACRNPNNS